MKSVRRISKNATASEVEQMEAFKAAFEEFMDEHGIENFLAVVDITTVEGRTLSTFHSKAIDHDAEVRLFVGLDRGLATMGEQPDEVAFGGVPFIPQHGLA